MGVKKVSSNSMTCFKCHYWKKVTVAYQESGCCSIDPDSLESNCVIVGEHFIFVELPDQIKRLYKHNQRMINIINKF